MSSLHRNAAKISPKESPRRKTWKRPSAAIEFRCINTFIISDRGSFAGAGCTVTSSRRGVMIGYMPRLGKSGLLWIDMQEWSLGRLDRLSLKLHRPAIAPHLAVGLRGELAALFELRRRGYTVVARRWSSPKARGDVDLIAWHEDRLCFIEVKTRSTRNLTPAESAVNDDKRRTLRHLARIYLATFPERERRTIPVRFDVVSVYSLSEVNEFEIFEGAFGWR